MENLNFVLFISIATPLTMMLFVCKDRTRALIVSFLTGMVTCLFSGEVAGLIAKGTDFSTAYIVTNFTPLFEELCKLAPILFYVLVFRPNKQQLIEYSLAVGAGFAVQENAYILALPTTEASLLLAIVRGFGAGMLHAVSTLGTGYGIGFIRNRRKFFAPYTMALLTAAVAYHVAYIQLLQSPYEKIAITLPMLTFALIVVMMKRQKWL